MFHASERRQRRMCMHALCGAERSRVFDVAMCLPDKPCLHVAAEDSLVHLMLLLPFDVCLCAVRLFRPGSWDLCPPWMRPPVFGDGPSQTLNTTSPSQLSPGGVCVTGFVFVWGRQVIWPQRSHCMCFYCSQT